MSMTGTLSDLSLLQVMVERHRALLKHGKLKTGPVRWSRLLREEMEEVDNELAALTVLDLVGNPSPSDVQMCRQRAICELAQLAQLALGIIEHLQNGRFKEEV